MASSAAREVTAPEQVSTDRVVERTPGAGTLDHSGMKTPASRGRRPKRLRGCMAARTHARCKASRVK
jgi:hypothetical protein